MWWGAEAFRRQPLLDLRGLGVKYVFAIAKVWGKAPGVRFAISFEVLSEDWAAAWPEN